MLHHSYGCFRLFSILILSDDAEKQRQRREKLKQWQERRLQNDFPGIRDQQQGNVTRSKKKVSKLGVGSKRRTGMGERKSEVGQGEKERDMQKFDADDYYEIPMEVESDSPGELLLVLHQKPCTASVATDELKSCNKQFCKQLHFAINEHYSAFIHCN